MSDYRNSIRTSREFLSPNLTVNKWEDILPWFENLLNRKLESISDVQNLLQNRSELEAVLEEDFAWLYIKMSCFTGNKDYAEAFNYFAQHIEPQIHTHSNELDKKIYQSPFFSQLPDVNYLVYKRNLKSKLELFREKNVKLLAELQVQEQEYGSVTAAMTVEIDNETLTLQQASNLLKNKDRTLRQQVYAKIHTRRLQDSEKLNALLDRLIEKRQEIASNADFSNYRDYKYNEMGRFDYTPQDIAEFCETIQITVCPVIDKLHANRKQKLKLDSLKPWDLEVDINGENELKPFKNTTDLISRTIACFNEIDPSFGDYLTVMNHNGYLDLESRIGKAPGGFNYPLYESNIPFIFMNATENFHDLVTMVHEGGHAIHSFVSKDLELVDFKNLTPEIAELASMSMELISMEHWHHFFNTEELKRAKRKQLEGVLSVMPWVAIIESFQNWIYTHKNHNLREREGAWLKIFNSLSSQEVNWDGLEEFKANLWQKQLHIYQVPFYYIEYAIAQLGTIAIWRNYKTNPKQTLKQYISALSDGYSKPIPEIYQKAGISFRFDVDYVNELVEFVTDELDKL
jgi:oligoendopeptidase F